MAIASEAPSTPTGSVANKGLKIGAIGLITSIVIAVASTAPAYSLASALGGIVGAVGVHAPGVLLASFVPMLFTAVAYRELNRAEPDCGTTFTWAARVFGSRTGWMGGWGIIAADIIVMANLAQIAGLYFFQLFGWNGLAGSTFWVTFCGVAWIVLMTALCYWGIEVSAAVQRALLGIELVMLLVFAVYALVKVYAGHGISGSIHPSISWLNPFGDGISFGTFTAGVLGAIFIYWGWDTAVSVNEETADPGKTPGRAAVVSTVLLLVTYLLVTFAAQAFAGVGGSGLGLGNADNSGDVLSGLGSAVFGTHGFGWFLAKLLVLMVLTSSAASTQTTILPTARTVLSMAAYRAIPARFARVHRRFLTPTWATIGMGLASIGFYVVMTKASSSILTDTILAVGVFVAFYYSMTAFTCVAYYRRTLLNSARDLWLRGVIPMLGGLMLAAILVYSLFEMWHFDYGSTYWTVPGVDWRVGDEFLISASALLLGVVLMFAYELKRPGYFRAPLTERVADVDAERVLAEHAGE